MKIFSKKLSHILDYFIILYFKFEDVIFKLKYPENLTNIFNSYIFFSIKILT